MKIAFYTLGCKVNQAETGAMRDFLVAHGHEAAGADTPCDAVVVNTCAVTAVGEQKSRQAIRRLRQKYSGAILAVCGCLAQRGELDGWSEIDVLSGTSDRLKFAAELEAFAVLKDEKNDRHAVATLEKPRFEPLPFTVPDGRSRAYLKIQDGCDNRCTYCVIPSLRGGSRSVEPDYAIAQARAAYEAGHRELCLTGIEISSCSMPLPELARALCEAAPGLLLRLGSLTPEIINEAFVKALASCGNLHPGFHLSIQSGCDSVLKRMGRRYTAARATEAAVLLRESFPGCVITGDIICGFPGETREEHAATLDFVRTLRPDKLHVFPYSRRPGTPAAAMPGQLMKAEKQRRAREIRLLFADTGAVKSS